MLTSAQRTSERADEQLGDARALARELRVGPRTGHPPQRPADRAVDRAADRDGHHVRVDRLRTTGARRRPLLLRPSDEVDDDLRGARLQVHRVGSAPGAQRDLFARPLAEGRLGPPGEGWDSVWERFPLFRHVWRVLTVVWGIGLLADAAIRVIVAYTLPVDLVPAANGIQYAVVYVVLQVISRVHLRRSGLMRLPGFAWSRRRTL